MEGPGLLPLLRASVKHTHSHLHTWHQARFLGCLCQRRFFKRFLSLANMWDAFALRHLTDEGSDPVPEDSGSL